RLVDRRAAEREPSRVHEDVDRAGGVDEPLAARRVGDVELERDLGLDAVDAARAAEDAHALRREHARRLGADAARRTGDDRRLARGCAHGAGRYPGCGRLRRGEQRQGPDDLLAVVVADLDVGRVLLALRRLEPGGELDRTRLGQLGAELLDLDQLFAVVDP